MADIKINGVVYHGIDSVFLPKEDGSEQKFEIQGVPMHGVLDGTVEEFGTTETFGRSYIGFSFGSDAPSVKVITISCDTSGNFMQFGSIDVENGRVYGFGKNGTTGNPFTAGGTIVSYSYSPGAGNACYNSETGLWIMAKAQSNVQWDPDANYTIKGYY